ncbi:MAG TPA: hypothetical protein VJZ00_00605 [Thermoanaerobaculia bacterium]|nr:hypothetical protein [Thermoanaerobaculia bacterium]
MDEFARWREAYEAAGIAAGEAPPAELRALVSERHVTVASTAARAVESANLLDPKGEVTTSVLLRELELPPPRLRGIRMPLLMWSVAIATRWIVRSALRVPRAEPAELQRVRDAARWLSELAETHETVLAVTHGSLRMLLAEELLASGWRREGATRGAHHWSAWCFTRKSGLP